MSKLSKFIVIFVLALIVISNFSYSMRTDVNSYIYANYVDENGNSLTFNDYEDESENTTVTYFIEKDDFTDEDYNMVLDVIYKDMEDE